MNPSPNLFLVGPMGAGKSSIGRQLARHFQMLCVDLDEEIEERAGASIAAIFEAEGEAGFRRRESAALAVCATREGIVLATGGGVVLDSANRALLRERGFVVWLEISALQQLERLVHDRQRPLLRAPDRLARLQQLADARDPLYREVAELAWSATDGESCKRSAARIATALETHWQRTSPGVCNQ